MFTMSKYLKATSLEEAFTLNKKRTNRIIGGMGWMKMSKMNVVTGIDLSGLGLDKIEETDDEFIIGAMVSLRQFETHQGLNEYFDGAAKESVKHIVGIQFRNCATMGGTTALHPGFSDPLTLLMVLDTTVEIYDGKEEHTLMPLSEYCRKKRDNSIVVALHVKKDATKVVYESFRLTETDFPILTVAVAKKDGNYVAAVGARPALAKSVCGMDIENVIADAKAFDYGSNFRGSAEYRQMLAEVLIRRAAEKLEA